MNSVWQVAHTSERCRCKPSFGTSSDAERMTLDAADFSLHECVDGVLRLLAERARGQRVELLTSLDPAVPRRLRGDATRLRQVLTNLVGNAVKFTTDGAVRVDVKPVAGSTADRPRLRFTVTDTGIGISAADQERIFDAFAQAGLRCFGPTRSAARLEGSKSFTKDFLARHDIPTGAYGTCAGETERIVRWGPFVAIVVVDPGEICYLGVTPEDVPEIVAETAVGLHMRAVVGTDLIGANAIKAPAAAPRPPARACTWRATRT